MGAVFIDTQHTRTVVVVVAPYTRTSSTFLGTSIISPTEADGRCRRRQQHDSGSGSVRLTMRVSGGTHSRSRVSKSSTHMETNNDRLRNAGRPGTVHFVDPTKLFIGNLPYTATEEHVRAAFVKHWNLVVSNSSSSSSSTSNSSSTILQERIDSIKIVRDWKTGMSKGYGFVQFYDVMAATSAMLDMRHGKSGELMIGGRKVRLDQGRRNLDDDNTRKDKKTTKKKKGMKKLLVVDELDMEGHVIYSALGGTVSEGGNEAMFTVGGDGGGIEKVNAGTNNNNKDRMSEDDMIAFMERGGLRGAMALTEETAGYLGSKGLYVDNDTADEELDFGEYYNENGYRDSDYSDDIDIEDEDDDGSELVYDGVFEEMYNPDQYENLTEEEEMEMAKMNREQRRTAEKKRKKRKLPFRGFGKAV